MNAEERRGEPALLRREEVYEGKIVRLGLDHVRFPDGSTGTVEMVRHRGAAAVVPLLDDPGSDDPRILLIRQYRYPAGGFIYEVPAGIPSGEGESWIECARRELREETGYQARELHPLTRIFTTPGFTDEEVHLFAATGLTEADSARDQDEFIELVPLRLSEAMTLIRTGELADGKSVAALLYVREFFLPSGR